MRIVKTIKGLLLPTFSPAGDHDSSLRKVMPPMSLDIINGALDDLERLREKLISLRAMAENDITKTETGQPPVKDRKGHLTEFGVAKLREWLDAGYTQSDIARALGITPAAVNNQRNIYLASR
jgi:hypothetical protein